MGHVTSIAKTNYFWVNDFHAFKEGLKGFLVGDSESPIAFSYSEYKRRSKRALINMSAGEFETVGYHQDDANDVLDLLTYIQKHLVDGEECVIHEVCYEHASDMSITHYAITKEGIVTNEILE